MAKKRLGIDELFRSTVLPAAAPEKGVVQLELDQIRPNPSQPRRYFDPVAMQHLVDSVRQSGVLQPILVREVEGGYEIVAGERRFQAARQVGLTHIPVIVRRLSDQEATQLALVENLQREDLNPVEETEGYLSLLQIRLRQEPEFASFSRPHDEDPYGDVLRLLFAMNNQRSSHRQGKAVNNNVVINLAPIVDEVFSSIGRTSWISFLQHRLPLRKLPEDVLEALRQGRLEYTKARQLGRLTRENLKCDPKDACAIRSQLLERILSEKLSLSELKTLVEAELGRSQERVEPLQERAVKLAKRMKKLRGLTHEQEQILLERIEALERYIDLLQSS